MRHKLEDRTPFFDSRSFLTRPFEAADPVVLPSGRRAIVIELLEDDRLKCQYLGGSPRDTVVISSHLARLIRPGVLPAPARVRKERR